MAIDVGDAVLKFIGDTSQLDAKFNSIGPKAEAAFEPAAEAAEDAGDRIGSSMREAKGEVALLGEEFGIRLPRHVRTFVAELPGVGGALSAAFSATAVLFLVKALVEGAEKLSNWIGDALIFTKTMKDSDAAIASSNVELVKLNKQYEQSKARLAELTEGPLAKLAKEENDLTKAFKANTEAAAKNQVLQVAQKSGWEKTKDTILDVGKYMVEYTSGVHLATSAENDHTEALARQQQETIRLFEEKKALDEQQKAHDEELRQTRIKDAIDAVENEKKIALASATTEENKYEIEQYYSGKKLTLVKEYGDKEKQQAASLAAEIEAAQIEHLNKVQAAYVTAMGLVKQAQQSAINDLKAMAVTGTISLSPLAAGFDKAREAAHSLGITLQTDLIDNLEQAKAVEQALIQASKDGAFVDPVAMKQAIKLVEDAHNALVNFGKAEDTFKLKSKGLWAEFQTEAKTGATAMDLVKQSGVQAFDDLSKNVEGAFSQVVLGEGKVGQALERATAASLASIAAQAAVKAIFYTAEGFAALVTNPSGAANYFTAAAEMATVAGVAGVAGRALSGAAGGSGGSTPSNFQGFSGGSNTSGSGQRGGVSVRAFADGGLITGPTLALAGESGPEAVLPLNDDVLGKLGAHVAAAISANGGGGHHMHVNVQGLVSDDKLANIMKKMSKLVNRGQASLQASHSLVINNRGGGGR